MNNLPILVMLKNIALLKANGTILKSVITTDSPRINVRINFSDIEVTVSYLAHETLFEKPEFIIYIGEGNEYTGNVELLADIWYENNIEYQKYLNILFDKTTTGLYIGKRINPDYGIECVIVSDSIDTIKKENLTEYEELTLENGLFISV